MFIIPQRVHSVEAFAAYFSKGSVSFRKVVQILFLFSCSIIHIFFLFLLKSKSLGEVDLLCEVSSLCVEELVDRKYSLFCLKSIVSERLYFLLLLKCPVKISLSCWPFFWKKESKLMLHNEDDGSTL